MSRCAAKLRVSYGEVSCYRTLGHEGDHHGVSSFDSRDVYWPNPRESREALLRWKAEALPLLAVLDRCHDLLPPDAQATLGASKAEAVQKYLSSGVDTG